MQQCALDPLRWNRDIRPLKVRMRVHKGMLSILQVDEVFSFSTKESLVTIELPIVCERDLLGAGRGRLLDMERYIIL